MRRNKKLILAVCGVCSMVSSKGDSMTSIDDAIKEAINSAPLLAEGSVTTLPSKDGFISSKDGGVVERPNSKDGGVVERPNSKDGGVVERPNSKDGGVVQRPSNKDGSVESGKGGTIVTTPSKEGGPDKSGNIEEHNNPELQCEWSGQARVIDSTCGSNTKRYCVGQVECVESGSSAQFYADASCLLSSNNGKDGGVTSCSSNGASDCANSETGIGDEDCTIEYYSEEEAVTGENNGKGGSISE